MNAIQIAPGRFESAAYISTFYTVTLPVSIAFSVFGVGILQARSTMVIFILISFISIYFLVRKNKTYVVTLILFLVAIFAPLYGQGKNVLGEVPELAF